jgi:hypothetical protein
LITAGLLAAGLQAQLRDAEAHAGEAEADQKAVRTAGLQLVRDTVTMFQLTATEVFGSTTLAFAQQQVSVPASLQVIACAYRLPPEALGLMLEIRLHCVSRVQATKRARWSWHQSIPPNFLVVAGRWRSATKGKHAGPQVLQPCAECAGPAGARL